MKIFLDLDSRQIHIKTQIRLNIVLTLGTKNLLIICSDNLQLYPKAHLKEINVKLLCNVIFPSLPGQSHIPCLQWSVFN